MLQEKKWNRVTDECFGLRQLTILSGKAVRGLTEEVMLTHAWEKGRNTGRGEGRRGHNFPIKSAVHGLKLSINSAAWWDRGGDVLSTISFWMILFKYKHWENDNWREECVQNTGRHIGTLSPKHLDSSHIGHLLAMWPLPSHSTFRVSVSYWRQGDNGPLRVLWALKQITQAGFYRKSLMPFLPETPFGSVGLPSLHVTLILITKHSGTTITGLFSAVSSNCFPDAPISLCNFNTSPTTWFYIHIQ